MTKRNNTTSAIWKSLRIVIIKWQNMYDLSYLEELLQGSSSFVVLVARNVPRLIGRLQVGVRSGLVGASDIAHVV